MRAAMFAIALSALPLAAIAQSATVDPPTERDVVRVLGGGNVDRIYKLECGRIDHRSFLCEFDMPPGAAIPHVRIKAVWVGSDWSISILN